MAITPLIPASVPWQSSLLEVLPTSRFHGPSDQVLVRSQLHVDPGGGGAPVVLPLAEPAHGVALSEFDGAGWRRVTLRPIDLDEARRRMAPGDGPAPDDALWEGLRAESRGGALEGRLDGRSARLLELTFSQEVPMHSDGGFELRLLGALAGAGGSRGPVAVALAMPRIPGEPAILHEGQAESPPGEPIESGKEHDLAGRRFISHRFTEPDPLLRVRYAYRRA